MGDSRSVSELRRLRAPERLALVEPDRVAELGVQGTTVKSALDVGTGTGLFAEAFAKRGLTVTGIDVDEKMLAAARQLVPEGSFERASAEKTHFRDGAFDLVFLGCLLHEDVDRQKALEEARRLARLRVAVLEWPYADDGVGPSLRRRLKIPEIFHLARDAGFTRAEMIPMRHTVYVRLDT